MAYPKALREGRLDKLKDCVENGLKVNKKGPGNLGVMTITAIQELLD